MDATVLFLHDARQNVGFRFACWFNAIKNRASLTPSGVITAEGAPLLFSSLTMPPKYSSRPHDHERKIS
jgi:hypothetical protein